jgi:hypothetical protein
MPTAAFMADSQVPWSVPALEGAMIVESKGSHAIYLPAFKPVESEFTCLALSPFALLGQEADA